MKFDWDANWRVFLEASVVTLQIVATALLVAGVAGLVLGTLLYSTRRGGVLQNRFVFGFLNVLTNFVRPIPFVIFLTLMGPITIQLVGSRIGTEAFIVPAAVMASFATGRIVEQNLVAVDPGLVEAARAMGASPWRIIRTVVIPEALGPLILGYTFIFVAIVDMSALAGMIAGGGLGAFALQYGYQRFDWPLTLITVAVIVVFVQSVPFFGNWLSRQIMRR
jgi:D-methionine transport system permease protein